MMVDVEDEYSRLTNMKMSLEETVEQVQDFYLTSCVNGIKFGD